MKRSKTKNLQHARPEKPAADSPSALDRQSTPSDQSPAFDQPSFPPSRPPSRTGQTRPAQTPTDESRPLRVHLVSLGCPKNLVDSEMILGNIGAAGHLITNTLDDTDVVVINTCGFIDNAKDESIQAILEACKWKEEANSSAESSSDGHPKRVVVTGCLGQRYGPELRKEIPEVDAIVGLGEYDDLDSVLRTVSDGSKVLKIRPQDQACNKDVGRFRLTPPSYSYVKISEGCDNPCTFCSIPGIRGGFRSKPIPMIVDEVRELVESGAKEVVLIAQDSTSYGVDSGGRYEFARLLESVASVDGVEWIRILYAYPAFLSDDMIDAIASIEKVVKYLDMPLQHISERMLRHMGRRMMEKETRRILDRLRERVPGIYLRTTFIVGFPGEDETEFGILRRFVEDFGFERLGVFSYSREEGTPSATFADQVPEDVCERRLEELMLAQQEVAFRHNRSRVGDEITVLVDEVATREDGEPFRLSARSFGEAPEIDPLIYIEGSDQAQGGGAPRRGGSELPESFREIPTWEPKPASATVGEFAKVRIVGTRDYDLVARPVSR